MFGLSRGCGSKPSRKVTFLWHAVWHLNIALTKSLQLGNVLVALAGADLPAILQSSDYMKSPKPNRKKGLKFIVNKKGANMSEPRKHCPPSLFPVPLGTAQSTSLCFPPSIHPSPSSSLCTLPGGPCLLIPGKASVKGSFQKREESGSNYSLRIEGFRFLYREDCSVSVP